MALRLEPDDILNCRVCYTLANCNCYPPQWWSWIGLDTELFSARIVAAPLLPQVGIGDAWRGRTMSNELKTAQMAAYLLTKSGGQMRYIKLVKLLYLSDRESMRITGDSMTHDRAYSLPNGPVLSHTLNLLKGDARNDYWSSLIRCEGFESTLVGAIDVGDLDELSSQDIEVLDRVNHLFGQFTWQALVDWTHKPENLAEWKDPHGSRLPIEPQDIFEALGWSSEDAHRLDAEYTERRSLDRLWSNYN